MPLAPGDTLPVGIERIAAATSTQAHGPSGVSVAVLDTGIDLANSDLNAVSGINCIKSGRTAQDDNGHGTNVAGIIAAKDQGAGVVGVAPGTKLYAVKVLGSTASGTLSQILRQRGHRPSGECVHVGVGVVGGRRQRRSRCHSMAARV